MVHENVVHFQRVLRSNSFEILVYYVDILTESHLGFIVRRP